MTFPSHTVYPENNTGQVFKVCGKCKQSLPLPDFYQTRAKVSRKLLIAPQCKNCCREAYRIDRLENTQKWVEKNKKRQEGGTQKREDLYWENRELPTTKICVKCGIDKPLDDYFRGIDSPLGRKTRCKECTTQDGEERTKRRIAMREGYPVSGEKVCKNPDCKLVGIFQPLINFFNDSSSADGKTYRCKECITAYNTQWALDNRDKKLETRRRGSSERYLATREAQWHVNAIRRLKTSSKKRSIMFDMKPEDLLVDGKLPEFCPIFPHIKLDYAAGPDRRIWASVDKIVPILGYTTGNVCIISMAANCWKDNGSNPAERARIVSLMKGKSKPPKDDSSQL